jgi:hypothetical protein
MVTYPQNRAGRKVGKEVSGVVQREPFYHFKWKGVPERCCNVFNSGNKVIRHPNVIVFHLHTYFILDEFA